MKKSLKFIKAYLIKNKTFFILWLISISVFLIWLVVFYPGFMSPDSLDQWAQARSCNFNDWHPYLSSFFESIFQKVFNTPVAIGIFFILITAGFFSYAFTYFLKKGINKLIIFLLYIIFVTSIPIGLYNITLWKDIPFSLSLVILCFMLAKYVIENKVWSRSDLFVAILSSVIVTMFRHNGIVYGIFIPVLILIIGGLRKWVRYFLIIFISVVFFFNFIFPKLIDVKGKPFWFSATNFFAYHMSVGIYANAPNTYVTENLKQTLETVFKNKDSLKASYNRLSWNSLYWNDNVKLDVFNSKQFWDDLMPEFYKNNFFPNLNFILNEKLNTFFDITTNVNYYNSNIYEDKIGNIQTISPIGDRSLLEIPNNNSELLPLRNTIGKTILKWDSTNSIFGKVIWNLSVPIGLLIFAFIYGILKRKLHLFTFCFLLIIQLPVLLIFNVSADWRYFYAFYLSGFIIIPLTLYTLQNKYGKNSLG